jgi:hypothetical protein
LDNGAAKTFKIYWGLYGGWRALATSPFLYLAVILTALLRPFWSSVAADGSVTWAQVAIDIVPSMLGFSMGGMAIMLAFSDGKFFTAITQKGKADSFFVKVVASFYHFIVVQSSALIFALVGKAYSHPVLSGVGVGLLLYAMLTAVAVAGQLLHAARIFNATARPSPTPVTPDQDVGSPVKGGKKLQRSRGPRAKTEK